MTAPAHQTGTREDWRAARLALLEREKQLTRLSDELARERQALPWVPIDKEYVFDTVDGPRTLAELFRGRSQLIVQHLMFGPGWEEACRSCSAVADGIELSYAHLEAHDVAFTAVSRAPLDELLPYKERMGWTFHWASSHSSDFNFDFHVSSTPERPLREYNFRATEGSGGPGELPGMSAFALRDGQVFHTYSTYSRGLDVLWAAYQWLDRAPLGRNEDGVAMPWMRRRHEYEAAVA